MSASKSILSIGTALALVIGGCAAPQQLSIQPVIGPDPSSPSTAVQGRLAVYTDVEITGSGDGQSSSRRPYSLYDSTGRLLAEIRGGSEIAPDTVTVAAGEYRVLGIGLSGKRIDVRVLVEPGKLTEVYLDRSRKLEASTALNSAVLAPDGSFLGWRAEGLRTRGDHRHMDAFVGE